MTKHIVTALITLSLPAALVGCATTKHTIFPGEDQNRIVINGYSESKANEVGLQEAQKYCLETEGGKRAVFTNQTAEYKGMNKNAKAAAGILGALTNTYTQTDSIDDNTVTLYFKCVK